VVPRIGTVISRHRLGEEPLSTVVSSFFLPASAPRLDVMLRCSNRHLFNANPKVKQNLCVAT
jgi:hypothetical protein